ncbi:MAG: adenine nucleotide alpha hydrolase family protein [Actinobacteria bacterium]|nr:adenine nucleotide alpha hydrolase family protein [Actinomycetota bacterium]
MVTKTDGHGVDMVEGRCRICGDSTEILRLTEFNLKLCRHCFVRFFERRVRRALEKHAMLGEGDRVALAVSGGKDSTALLFALKRLGVAMDFELRALHFHLNMGEYSDRNLEAVAAQADLAGVPLEVVRIADLGLRVQRVKGWNSCAVCGAIKRSLLNREARRMEATVVATAHTLEDVLLFSFKNLLSRKHYVPQPVLPATGGLARKVKPLVYTPERLNLVYCRLRDLPVFEDKCPEWTPRGHSLKEVFEHMEEVMPSGKLQLLLSFMEAFPGQEEEDDVPRGPCARCGEPTSRELCAICQLADWFSTRPSRPSEHTPSTCGETEIRAFQDAG